MQNVCRVKSKPFTHLRFSKEKALLSDAFRNKYFYWEKAPNDYFSKALAQCGFDNTEIGTITDVVDFWRNIEMNCIPKDIVSMTADNYFNFLNSRRIMMAKKIKDYSYSL